jgi:hypothetical protein
MRRTNQLDNIYIIKGLKAGRPGGLSLGILGGKIRHSFPQKRSHFRVGLFIDSRVYPVGVIRGFLSKVDFQRQKGRN